MTSTLRKEGVGPKADIARGVEWIVQCIIEHRERGALWTSFIDGLYEGGGCSLMHLARKTPG